MATIRRHARVLAIAAVLLPLSVASTSAGVCDLTASGSTCSNVSFGGAIYTNVVTSPTTTFTIDPFLQMKATNTSSTPTTEKGYNTGGTLQTGFQQSNETSNLLLTDVPITTIGGVQYREFLLTIDEPGGAKALLSLDQLQVFLSPTQSLTNYQVSSSGIGQLNGLTAVYDMDAGGDPNNNNYVKLSYSVQTGTKIATGGQLTAVVYIPNALFTQSSNPQYVYLYSQFGGVSFYGAEGGLETWWVRTNGPGTQVTLNPEPGSMLLLGTGIALLGARARKRRRLTAS
jgi:hypothetical protein